MIARSILIEGSVQGVSFRDWTVRQAQGLGLSGWVRNRRKGRVEVYVVGAPEPVDRLIDRLREGPPAAQVATVLVRRAEIEAFGGFGRRPTV